MADDRGSVIAVADDAGAALRINSYDEYGIPDANHMGRFGYTGQMWLPDVGLYDYKARMYSPTLGRFMQTDPTGYAAGLNLYSYVGNDPIDFIDPSGLFRLGGGERSVVKRIIPLISKSAEPPTSSRDWVMTPHSPEAGSPVWEAP